MASLETPLGRAVSFNFAMTILLVRSRSVNSFFIVLISGLRGLDLADAAIVIRLHDGKIVLRPSMRDSIQNERIKERKII
jgi:hypothetical protein